jgi:Uma2 family endonuclease
MEAWVNAMAIPERDDIPEDLTFAGGFLTPVDHWTGELAMKLLPQTNGPKVEVFRGSVIASPHASVDRQIIAAELIARLRRAAKQAGFWAYPEVNVLHGEELYIPDISVFRKSGAGQASMDIADAVLLVEIVSNEHRRKAVIHRPKVYAEAGVPWYMRVEFRRRVPTVVLSELVDGECRTVVAAAAGSTFDERAVPVQHRPGRAARRLKGQQSMTIGAWSEGPLPLRASRSMYASVTASATDGVTYARSMRMPMSWWNIPAR